MIEIWICLAVTAIIVAFPIGDWLLERHETRKRMQNARSIMREQSSSERATRQLQRKRQRIPVIKG